MKLASLRFRVTSWYSSLLATALVVFGAAVFLGLQNYLVTSMQHNLRDEATNIAQQFLSEVEERGTHWMTAEIEESYAPEGDGQYIRILRNGQPLYQSRNSPAELASSLPAGLSDAQGIAAHYQTLVPQGGRRILLYTYPYTSPTGVHFIVQTGMPTEAVDSILRSLLIALCLLTPIILSGAAVGGHLLMNVPFRPVVALTLQAEQIGKKGMGERLPMIHTGDELERLSISLNQMITRLEDALAHNHRFSADVSHELRTPLTIMRGELEPLVEAEGLPLEAVDAVGSALEEIDRMSDIVESLLAISKLDSQASIPRLPVKLDALSSSTVEQMQLVAEDKHVSLRAEVREEVWVPGDLVRLQQLIVNLLDNAIKYTRSGGRVHLKVTSQGSRALLEIDDDGIGIPAECLPFVFERFYRADKARSRESGGAGLGLSIVKAICTAHEGAVSIQSREGMGTTVRVDLPLCSLNEIAQEKVRQADVAARRKPRENVEWEVKA
jgi:signal transduction histidine kinase